MTRQEFKTSVHRRERFERFFGYVFLLSPLAIALSLLCFVVVEYFKDPVTSFLIWFALIVTLPCAALAWWGVRRIKRKFRDILIITYDDNQVTERELINLVAEKMTCRIQKHESGLLLLRSTGWQTAYVIYIGRQKNELYADLRLSDNTGFLTWGLKKLKQRFVAAIDEIGKEIPGALSVDIVAT